MGLKIKNELYDLLRDTTVQQNSSFLESKPTTSKYFVYYTTSIIQQSVVSYAKGALTKKSEKLGRV